MTAVLYCVYHLVQIVDTEQSILHIVSFVFLNQFLGLADERMAIEPFFREFDLADEQVFLFIIDCDDVDFVFVSPLPVATESGESLCGIRRSANASKHKALSYAHADALQKQLEAEVKTLMQKAEEIDRFFDPNYFPMLSPIRIDIKTIPLYNTHTSFINGIQYENTRLLRL